jgi:hypothetical protein
MGWLTAFGADNILRRSPGLPVTWAMPLPAHHSNTQSLAYRLLKTGRKPLRPQIWLIGSGSKAQPMPVHGRACRPLVPLRLCEGLQASSAYQAEYFGTRILASTAKN